MKLFLQYYTPKLFSRSFQNYLKNKIQLISLGYPQSVLKCCFLENVFITFVVWKNKQKILMKIHSTNKWFVELYEKTIVLPNIMNVCLMTVKFQPSKVPILQGVSHFKTLFQIQSRSKFNHVPKCLHKDPKAFKILQFDNKSS